MFAPTCGIVGVFTGFLAELLFTLGDAVEAGGGGGCDMKAFCKVA